MLCCVGWWPGYKEAGARVFCPPLLLPDCSPCPSLSGVLPAPFVLWGLSCPRYGPEQGLVQDT